MRLLIISNMLWYVLNFFLFQYIACPYSDEIYEGIASSPGSPMREFIPGKHIYADVLEIIFQIWYIFWFLLPFISIPLINKMISSEVDTPPEDDE